MAIEIRYRLVKCNIDRLLNSAKAACDDCDAREEFLVSAQDVDKLSSKFFDAHVSIEAAKKAGFCAETHATDFETYMSAIDKIKVIRNRLSPKESVPKSSVPAVRSDLPRISLPTFNGSITEWTNFYNIFNSIVGNDLTITNVRKLHYLLSCLSNEPLDLIKHLTISEENYSVAVRLLESRYRNTRLIASNHLEAIFNLPVISNIKLDLRSVLNTFNENIEALKALNFKVNAWSFILLHILLKRLPSDLRNQFELTLDSNDIPNYTILINFLETRSKAYEFSAISSKAIPPITQSKRSVKSFSPKNVKSNHIQSAQCLCCHEEHTLSVCTKFNNLTLEERNAFARSKQLCFNCLEGHRYKDCVNKTKCEFCKGKHHKLLCFKNKDSFSANSLNNNSDVSMPSLEQSERQVSVLSEAKVVLNSVVPKSVGQPRLLNVLLGTAVAYAIAGDGTLQAVRLFLDPGSQCTIISEACFRRHQLRRSRYHVTISGVGSQKPLRSNGTVTLHIKSQFSEDNVTVSAIVLPRITGNMPSFPISSEIVNEYKHIHLADDKFFDPRPVDVLLGSDVYNDINLGQKITVSREMPSAYSTIFGWVIIGNASKFIPPVESSFLSHHVILDECLERFWDLENLPSLPLLSPDEERCEELFKSTVCRDDVGRFVVSLPFKGDVSLGNTRDSAVRRFFALERRLCKNVELRKEYTAVIHEYLQLGHMTPVPITEYHQGKYYIPHHCVLKEGSTTTKVRVVFDTSMPSSNGFSLNDALLPEPKLQQHILDIIMRFRLNKVAFVADIRQMYREVRINSEDSDFQVILWRDRPEETLKEFRLNTVTFGVSSAPYLAMRCILQLSEEGNLSHPNASRILKRDIFVDDVVSGAPDIPTAIIYRDELNALLRQGCFQLRKWVSSHPEVTSDLPEALCKPLTFESEGDKVIKVLGIKWNPTEDAFTYHNRVRNFGTTKRAVLSNIACFYDPCGWLTPVTFSAKYFMQQIWLLGIGWDDPLPKDFQNYWMSFLQDFSSVEKIKLSRFILSPDLSNFQLHSFCDASEKGYAAVVYLRVERSNSDVDIHLLMSKSKVAPIKTKLTIPRLELCGALMLSAVLRHCIDILGNVELQGVYAWWTLQSFCPGYEHQFIH